MECLLSFLGMLLFLLPLPTDASIQENIYASGCTGEEVSLQCPPNHRIAIKRLFYGVKRSWDCQADRGIPRKAGCCHAAHTDCLVNDDTKYPTLNTHCSGYQQCKIVVQKVPASSSCTDAPHTDYMTVIFDCVPEMDIATFCSNDMKRGRTLYLANLEYPSSVREEKADCSCLVRTGETEGINIHSIDVLLAWAEHGTRSCSKELVIKDENGYRWDIQCGHIGFYGFRTIYTRPVHNVTLTLKSSTGKGAAFIWLQAKATNTDDEIEIFCGEPLRQLLIRLRQEVESRHRTDHSERTTPSNKNLDGKNSTFPYAAHVGSLSSNLAAIIGGIVAAGFVLISIVIIAIAFHCRRVQQAKKKANPINLYPAVTNGETTNLTSYCRYDLDDDHYSSINRSPLKMSSLTDSDIATNHARTNGFVTLATAEAHPQSPREHNHTTVREDNAVQPIQHTGQSARDPLLSDPAYSGHLSLRFSRPAGAVHSADIHDGHKTLPDNRTKILVSGPKSPLGKRSKSVTFSQPVAMVTPLPSGSDESMMADEIMKGSPTSSLEDGNYDNLNKVFIPDHPLSPTQIHTVAIQHSNNMSRVGHMDANTSPQHQGYVNSLPCSLTTFRAEDDGGDMIKDYDEVGPYNLPPPPPPIINGDTYAVVHKPKPVPVYHPQRQNAQLYETGV